jgi:hypothetical protein
MTTINPELVAAKLKLFRETNPAAAAVKFGEVAWFIQSAALRPGGIGSFVKGLIAEFPEHFQLRSMAAVGKPEKSGRFSLRQCIEIWKELESAPPAVYSRLMMVDYGDYQPVRPGDTLRFDDFLNYFVLKGTTVADATGDSQQAVALRRAFELFNVEFLSRHCQEVAEAKLPALLVDICQNKACALAGPYYCPDLPALLSEAMMRHAGNAQAQLVQTVVTKTIFREFEFACNERVPVPFVGESRFGKTKSVSGWCDAYPGLGRLVTTPDSPREIDFIRAHADAYGIDYTPATSVGVLKDKVEFVVRHSGLMVVYDEAHFLIPISYHKATPPRRLNWVRAKVIDQDVPCVFFATPQSYDQTLEKYVKTTGYRMEQWLGRMAPPVILSDKIPFEEIVAVARKHFPEFPELLLEEIADRAILSDGHLKNMELAGRRARFLARERKHPTPTLQDVMDAIDEMMPSSPRNVSHQPEVPPAAPLPSRCTQPATAPRVAPANEFSRRGTDTGKLIPAPAMVK